MNNLILSLQERCQKFFNPESLQEKELKEILSRLPFEMELIFSCTGCMTITFFGPKGENWVVLCSDFNWKLIGLKEDISWNSFLVEKDTTQGKVENVMDKLIKLNFSYRRIFYSKEKGLVSP